MASERWPLSAILATCLDRQGQRQKPQARLCSSARRDGGQRTGGSDPARRECRPLHHRRPERPLEDRWCRRQCRSHHLTLPDIQTALNAVLQAVADGVLSIEEGEAMASKLSD